MSHLLATIGGFLLVPVAGTLATHVVKQAAKTTDPGTGLMIGAACHAAVAFGAYHFEDSVHDGGVKAFLHGGTWGEGISAGLLAAAGAYLTTEQGKQAYAKLQSKQLSSGDGTALKIAGLLAAAED